jgi:hypothetical protein
MSDLIPKVEANNDEEDNDFDAESYEYVVKEKDLSDNDRVNRFNEDCNQFKSHLKMSSDGKETELLMMAMERRKIGNFLEVFSQHAIYVEFSVD